MEKIYEQVERNIDNLVENNVNWSACATSEQMQRAREGQLKLHLSDIIIGISDLKDKFEE